MPTDPQAPAAPRAAPRPHPSPALASARVNALAADPAQGEEVWAVLRSELQQLALAFRWAERFRRTASADAVRARLQAQREAFFAARDLTWLLWDRAAPSPFIGELRIEREGLPEGLVAFHIWVRADHSGRGLAREASARVFTHLFEDLDVDVIEALCRPSNAASRRLLMSLGFERWGSVKDHDRYLLFAHQWPKPSAPP